MEKADFCKQYRNLKQQYHPGEPLSHRERASNKDNNNNNRKTQLIILLIVATLVPWVYLIGAKRLEGWPVNMLYFHSKLKNFNGCILATYYFTDV